MPGRARGCGRGGGRNHPRRWRRRRSDRHQSIPPRAAAASRRPSRMRQEVAPPVGAGPSGGAGVLSRPGIGGVWAGGSEPAKASGRRRRRKATPEASSELATSSRRQQSRQVDRDRGAVDPDPPLHRPRLTMELELAQVHDPRPDRPRRRVAQEEVIRVAIECSCQRPRAQVGVGSHQVAGGEEDRFPRLRRGAPYASRFSSFWEPDAAPPAACCESHATARRSHGLAGAAKLTPRNLPRSAIQSVNHERSFFRRQ